MNPASLYLILDCMSLVGAGLLFGVGLGRRSATLKWWGLGYCLGSLGLTAIILGYMGPTRSLVVWGSAIVLSAYGMLWGGIRSLSGASRLAMWLIPAGLLWLPIGFSPPLAESEPLRMIVYGPCAAAFMFGMAQEFARVPGRPVGRIPLCLLALGQGLFYLARSVDMLLRPGPAAAFWQLVTPLEGMFFVFCDAFLVMSFVRSWQERELAEAAYTDFLSGVLNRRRFTQLAQQALETAPCAILLFDIDHFKQVNDQFGHAAGDQLLREFGAICRRHVRAVDLIGRLGGDEFAVLIRGAEETATAVAEDVRAAFAETCAAAGWPAAVSIGSAIHRSGVASLDVLISQADQALYDAKRRRSRDVPLSA